MRGVHCSWQRYLHALVELKPSLPAESWASWMETQLMYWLTISQYAYGLLRLTPRRNGRHSALNPDSYSLRLCLENP